MLLRTKESYQKIRAGEHFSVRKEDWINSETLISLEINPRPESRLFLRCPKSILAVVPSARIIVKETNEPNSVYKGEIYEVPLDQWNDVSIHVLLNPTVRVNFPRSVYKARFELVEVQYSPQIKIRLKDTPSNYGFRLSSLDIVTVDKTSWDDRNVGIGIQHPNYKGTLNKDRFEVVSSSEIPQQITPTSGQINQPKGNEMGKSVDLAFLKSIANVDEKDEFSSVLTAGPAKSALEAAKAKRKEQQEARLGEEMLNILEQLDLQKKSRIESIRQYRANISRMKTELDQMDRAMAYANETNNFLPLCKLMSLVRGDTPEFEVPKDWTPKEISKAE